MSSKKLKSFGGYSFTPTPFPFTKGGLTSSNLAMRAELKYFFQKRTGWTKMEDRLVNLSQVDTVRTGTGVSRWKIVKL